MKNIIENKEEKITDKLFMRNALVSVLSILLCIVSLCSITYAWFTTESSSQGNTLAAGSFKVAISAVDGDGDAVTPDSVVGGKYTYTLGEGSYVVSLVPDASSTSKGHCIVKIGDETLNTAAIVGENVINAAPEDVTATFTFTVVIPETTTVSVESRWGVVVTPDIENLGTVTVTTGQSTEEPSEG